MKRSVTSAAIAVLTFAGMSQAHAWGLTGSYSKATSTTQNSGKDSISQGKNSGGRDRWEIKNHGDYSYDGSTRISADNRNSGNRTTTSNVDSRNMSDNRHFNAVDSRNMSTTSIDSRNMSDNRHTTTVDSRNLSDNRIDNQRYQSHNYGDGAIVINGEGYKPRVGHENAGVSGMSGSNNYVDQSVSGNFGIGHTTVKP